MRPESEVLYGAMTEAYRPYVEAMVADRAPEMPLLLDAAIVEGRSWLEAALSDLLSLPFREQHRGPLEVFQDAMRFPTAALTEAGLTPSERDQAAITALPGDLFDLAPSSSQALGERVWEVHLAWGAAKAQAFRSSIGLLSANLMDVSRVESVAASAGFHLIVWRTASDLDPLPTRPAMAFVDLAHGDADAVIEQLSASGLRVIGFGPHVDDLAMVRARTLGAADALARSAFFRNLGRLLPTAV